MIKQLLLLSALIVFSNSAISQTEPKQTKTDSESAALIENEPPAENALQAESPVQYEEVEKSKEAELICTKERKTGSRLYTKVCRTKAQIEAERASGAEHIRRIQSTPQSSSEGGG